MKILISFVVLVVILMIGLNFMRSYDELRSYLIWKKLEKVTLQKEDVFSPTMVENLPGPARRYFEYTMSPGTPLKRVSEIKMGGRLGLGPNWSLFWLMHSIPLGRAGGLSSRREDHRRAAFGRLVAEAVFWSPASLLPSETVSWEAIDTNAARATVRSGGLVQTVDIFLNKDGQPVRVIIPRWSDANPDNIYQLQPFGGYLSVFKEFEGYRLPTHVEGGNFIGTDRYFPFYIADVEIGEAISAPCPSIIVRQKQQ